MYDVPAYRQQERTEVCTNPDGTTYEVTIPAYNVPASKGIMYNPATWDEVRAKLDEMNQRAMDNPPE